MIEKCLCLLCCITLVLCGSAWARETPDTGDKSYTLFAGGDTMLGRRFPAMVYEKGPTWPLAALLPLISGADVAMINLECVLSSRGTFWNKDEEDPFYFRAPPVMADVLTRAGFDVVMTANNHAMDYGPEALLEEHEILDAVGIAAPGSGANREEAAAPRYVKVGDLVLAFIGLTTYNRPIAAQVDRPGVQWAEDNARILKVLQDSVAEARRHADLVIFSPHWGGNWTEQPGAGRVALAHAIIDLGVDGILGHSAHQLHGIEVYKNRPIVYDMGNFLWDVAHWQKRGQVSAAFLLDFDRSGFKRLSIYPIKLLVDRTVPAEGHDLRQVETTMINLTRKLDPEVTFQHTDRGLVLALHPGPGHARRHELPKKLYEAGHQRPLPASIRLRRGNAVYDAVPDWVKTGKPIRLSHGVEFLGARLPEAVRDGSGFAADIFLRVGGPLHGGWYGVIKGVRRDGRDRFVWPHPIANGGWTPEIWRKGEIGDDVVLVRPPLVKGGTYRLFWRLEKGSGAAAAVSANYPNGYIPLGEIWIGSLGMPKGPSGVAWSGRLDTDQTILKKLNITRAFILWFVHWGGAIVIVVSVVLYFVYRRRSMKAD